MSSPIVRHCCLSSGVHLRITLDAHGLSADVDGGGEDERRDALLIACVTMERHAEMWRDGELASLAAMLDSIVQDVRRAIDGPDHAPTRTP